MAYIMSLFLAGLVLGLVAVASNPAPYFAALGLVVAAGAGCGILVGHGGPFLSLVLFLIYLGGMLVVFAYSAALAAEPYPETWGDRSVLGYVVGYFLAVVVMAGWFWGGWYESSWGAVEEFKEFVVVRADSGGVALMFSFGGWVLVVCAGVLLLTLFVVLELTRGLSRGTLRAV
uniref:NADH-ubiquinone oxidoreductase chain 6 n=2 Tax=Protosalanx TaxID=182236 RepID=F1AWL0_9TELE|nr:NADH dehydrogenase subunit 6 [Protosalanx hyalocranius]YP_009641730.1 NADH dehydrogenase subunit 6 [Protosalanx chinensis]ADQ12884.1 NADH dehydrogenase subunit 6 [Protosalanx chinensis]AHY86312.1 NADH dehydrogenase subunit 6 [Protosalanx hyalocranius]AJP33417.1 NADH dehydrogenase subunit 6 [Protosalanx chinensis]QBZ37843.1 NADH dehydrogenase subunit 6 [Protosalanx chinensis]QUS64024.1 NADH dehydrogenase subunit 6 [Protosalanx chinensis]